jgi:hypothetical protein
VEVLNTSAMTREKRDALTASDVAWVEVRAKDVLDAYGAQGCGGRVRVVDCAAMQCDACVNRQAEMDTHERARRVLEEVERARQARFANERERARRVEANAEAARQAKHVIGELGSSLLAEKLGEGSEAASVPGQTFYPAPFWHEVITTTAETLGIDLQTINVQRESEMATAVVAKQAMLEASKSEGSNVLTFGKHAGVSVKMLFDDEETQPYVRWLAGYSGYRDGSGRNRPKLITDKAHGFVPRVVVEEAKALVRGRCLLCFAWTDQAWKNWCSNCFRDA